MGIPSTSNTGDQVRAGRRTWATRASSRLSTELDLLLLWSCVCLACLFPLEGPNSPSLTVSIGLFFLRSRLGFSPRLAGIWGGGGGGFAGGLDLFLSLGDDALFLLFISSFKLGPVLGAIASSSSEVSAIKVITWAGVCTHECSSAPSSASDIRMVSSSSNLKLSISCSREEEEAVPFPIIASPSGTCCNGWAAKGIPYEIGWSTGERSYEARKPSQETSIRVKRWSSAQIELPTSRNDLEIGSKSKIKWTARSCPSSFTKICDLSR